MQPGGNDGGVVAEEGVAGAEVFRQIAKMPVGDGAGLAVHDEQARFIATVGGPLGNEPLGQRVVEEVGFHFQPRD